MSVTIDWNKKKLEALKKLYKKADENNWIELEFEKHVILTRYAKYLIEHLETLNLK